MATYEKINILSRLTVSCLILFSITNLIETRHVENQNKPETYLTYSVNEFKLGYGTKTEDLPTAECAYSDSVYKYNCTLRTRTGATCQMGFGNDSIIAGGLDHVMQLSENKLMIMFYLMSRINDDVVMYNDIYTVDMATCTNAIIPRSFSTEPKVIKQENGFNVVVDGENIVRYDVNGNLIGELKLDLANDIVCEDFRAMSDNFFMFTYNRTNNTVEIVDRDGKKIKSILTFPRNYMGHLIHSNQSTYSVCWKNIENKKTIQCKQFDEFGNEKFSQQTEVDYEGFLLDVRHLKAGGVVVFSVTGNYPRESLHVTKIRPESEADTLTFDNIPSLGYQEGNRVIDFNEDDGKFKLAYISMYGDKRQGIVYLQKLALS